MDFPLPFLLCSAGFGLILCVERVLSSAHAQLEAAESREHGAVAAPAQPSLVLDLVLSVHSVFAGVALGIESSMLASMAIFIAIIAHKGSTAFPLAVSLLRSWVGSKKFRKIILVFSCLTPLGILLGMFGGAVLSGPLESGVEGVFDSLATGTFLYVAIVDVIGEEFDGGGAMVAKFLLFLAGLGGMAALALWLSTLYARPRCRASSTLRASVEQVRVSSRYMAVRVIMVSKVM